MPRSADGLVYRGNVLTAKGDYDKAIADLSEAIRREPRSRRRTSSAGSCSS